MKQDEKVNLIEPLPLVGTLLLAMIHQYPKSTGYQLIKLIAEFTNNTITLRTGTAYPELRRMEDKNLVESCLLKDKRQKRQYLITDLGRHELHRRIGIAILKVKRVILPLISLVESDSSLEDQI